MLYTFNRYRGPTQVLLLELKTWTGWAGSRRQAFMDAGQIRKEIPDTPG